MDKKKTFDNGQDSLKIGLSIASLLFPDAKIFCTSATIATNIANRFMKSTKWLDDNTDINIKSNKAIMNCIEKAVKLTITQISSDTQNKLIELAQAKFIYQVREIDHNTSDLQKLLEDSIQSIINSESLLACKEDIDTICDKFVENFEREILNNQTAFNKHQINKNKEYKDNFQKIFYLLEIMEQNKKSNKVINTAPLKNKSIYFKGRDQKLKKMEAILKKDNNIVIYGISGVGKTQLILEYINIYCKSLNNIIWINGKNEETIKHSLMNIYEQIYGIIDGKQFTIDLILNYFENKGDWIFVFDGVDIEKINIRDFFPNNILGKIIITSVHNKWPGFNCIELLSLDDDISYEILNKATMNRISTLTDDVDIKELVKLLEGMPLAIEHAIAYINDNAKIRDYINLFNKSKEEALTTETFIYPSSLYIAWELTFKKLQSMEKDIVKILNYAALLDSTQIPDYLFYNYIGDDIKKVDIMKLLKRYCIFHFDDDKISIHSLIQKILIDKMQSHKEGIIEICNSFLSEIPCDVKQNYKLKDLILHFCSLYENLKKFEFLKDDVMLGKITLFIADSFNLLSDFESVILYANESLQYYDEEKVWSTNISACYYLIGVAYSKLLDTDKAIDYFNKALARIHRYFEIQIQLDEEDQEKVGAITKAMAYLVCQIYNSFFYLYKNTGQTKKAREAYINVQECNKAYFKLSGEENEEMKLRERLGEANILKEDKDYLQVINICEEIKSNSKDKYPYIYAGAIATIGDMYRYLSVQTLFNKWIIADRDMFDKALEHSKEAYKAFELINDRRSQCRVCCSLGLLELAENKLDKALEYLNESLKMAQETKSDGDIAAALFNIGRITKDDEKLLLSYECIKKTHNEVAINEMKNGLSLLGLNV